MRGCRKVQIPASVNYPALIIQRFPTPPHPLYPRAPLPLSPRSAPCPIFRLAIRTTGRTSRRGRSITRGIAPLSPSGSRISRLGGLGGIRLCRTRRGRRSWPMSGCCGGGDLLGGLASLRSGPPLAAVAAPRLRLPARGRGIVALIPPSRSREGLGAGRVALGRKAHPAATNLACGSASVLRTASLPRAPIPAPASEPGVNGRGDFGTPSRAPPPPSVVPLPQGGGLIRPKAASANARPQRAQLCCASSEDRIAEAMRNTKKLE